MDVLKLLPTYLAVAFLCASAHAEPTRYEADESMPTECEIPKSLRSLEDQNPESDARAAIEKLELRFLGVYGFTLMIPGLSNEEESCAKSRYLAIGIDGTSDAIMCREHYRLQSVAREYARRYNQVILKAWAEVGRSICAA